MRMVRRSSKYSACEITRTELQLVAIEIEGGVGLRVAGVGSAVGTNSTGDVCSLPSGESRQVAGCMGLEVREVVQISNTNLGLNKRLSNVFRPLRILEKRHRSKLGTCPGSLSANLSQIPVCTVSIDASSKSYIVYRSKSFQASQRQV